MPTYYIDYDDITSVFDAEAIERTTDELSAGLSNQNVVENLIKKAENEFESNAVRQYSLDVLRAAKPELAQKYITDIVVYVLHKRRGAVPAEIIAEYLRTREKLDEIRLGTGPELIIDPAVITSIAKPEGNMTEADLEVMPWESENIKSVWKGLP